MPEEKIEDVLYDFANETMRNLDGNADPTEDLMENLYANFIKIWTYLKHSIFKTFWIFSGMEANQEDLEAMYCI